jgi:filamentous hemagglutinin
MSYANAALSIDALNENMTFSDYAQNAAVRGTAQGISSEIMGGEFKDGFKKGAALSVFNDGALQMRKYVKDNFDYAGKNGEVVPDNVRSVGVNGDGVKLGGSGLDPSTGKEVIAPFGGAQTGKRLVIGMPYDEGGVVDKTVEYFAGPHDFMSSWNYENIDGKTFLQSDGTFVNTASGLLLLPAAPFAAAPFIQNNINEINAISNMKKQEKQKVNNILETYNQNKQLAQEIQSEN